MSRVLKKYNNKVSCIYRKGIHNGIDIIGDNGKNNTSGYLDYIIAHSDGVVIEARNNYATNDKTGSSYGNYVLIKHDNGMYTLYAHMKYGSVTVKKGDRVSQGQVIGYMGNTGHSFGAHLHFEVRDTNNIKIDPTNYINADLPNLNQKEEPKEEITFDLLLMVKKTIRGDYGSGDARKKSLGDNYSKVQDQVNLNYKNGTTRWDNVKIY